MLLHHIYPEYVSNEFLEKQEKDVEIYRNIGDLYDTWKNVKTPKNNWWLKIEDGFEIPGLCDIPEYRCLCLYYNENLNNGDSTFIIAIETPNGKKFFTKDYKEFGTLFDAIKYLEKQHLYYILNKTKNKRSLSHKNKRQNNKKRSRNQTI